MTCTRDLVFEEETFDGWSVRNGLDEEQERKFIVGDEVDSVSVVCVGTGCLRHGLCEG
jgi:hypothetical protein